MLTAFGRANRCSDTQDLIDELAGHIGVPSDYLLLDNGSIDVIAAIVRATVASGHDVILTVCVGELFVDVGANYDCF
jgi:histidinol-phosphate/aromatic aminotransferase/cobyric acid decarboxylase-like protein